MPAGRARNGYIRAAYRSLTRAHCEGVFVWPSSPPSDTGGKPSGIKDRLWIELRFDLTHKPRLRSRFTPDIEFIANGIGRADDDEAATAISHGLSELCDLAGALRRLELIHRFAAGKDADDTIRRMNLQDTRWDQCLYLLDCRGHIGRQDVQQRRVMRAFQRPCDEADVGTRDDRKSD